MLNELFPADYSMFAACMHIIIFLIFPIDVFELYTALFYSKQASPLIAADCFQNYRRIQRIGCGIRVLIIIIIFV